MRKYPQLALSYLCYWIGLAFWAVCDRYARDENADGEPVWMFSATFRGYQWFMLASHDLDEWDVLWKPARSETSGNQ